MSQRDRLLLSEIVLILSVALPLCWAEGNWWPAAVAMLGAFIGGGTTILRRRPVLSARSGRLIVPLAFIILLTEFRYLPHVPGIMAISHFMILVCVSKWLYARSLRDDAQVLILSLLLLAVAAIVSGSLLFPIALAVYLTLGIYTLIRFRLLADVERASVNNTRIHALSTQIPDLPPKHRPTGISLSLGATAVAMGIAVFLASPRTGAGMFGTLRGHQAGHTVTGLAATLHFDNIGPIRESNRRIMRVQLESEQGNAIRAAGPLHFRANTLDLYRRRTVSGGRRHWRWERSERASSRYMDHPLVKTDAADRSVQILPMWSSAPMLIQRYFLEPTNEPTILTLYPAIQIDSPNISRIRRWPDSQALLIHGSTLGVFQYTVHSPITPSIVADVLADERGYEPVAPDVSLELDRSSEILAMIDKATADLGPLDDSEKRVNFIRRLVDLLQSPPFEYTLSPPPVPDNVDPVAHFLLDTKRGHCEYFASALTVMCQLKGIPARVTNGYLNGDYNSFGGFYLIRAKHAHSWVEAYIPNLDWVTFDPTPGAGTNRRAGKTLLAKAGRYLDVFRFYWANGVMEYSASDRRRMLAAFANWIRRPVQDERTAIGAVVAFVRELFGWRLKMSWKERLIYWVFTILILLMAILLTYVMVSLLRWGIRAAGRLQTSWAATRPRYRPPQVEFYNRFRKRLAKLGLHRPPDQTAAEFANWLSERHAALADAPLLVEAYYQVAFGQRQPSRERQDRIEVFLRRLRNLSPDQIHSD